MENFNPHLNSEHIKLDIMTLYSCQRLLILNEFFKENSKKCPKYDIQHLRFLENPLQIPGFVSEPKSNHLFLGHPPPNFNVICLLDLRDPAVTAAKQTN